MPIPVLAAIAVGATVEAATGVVSKTFKSVTKKSTKKTTKKTSTRKAKPKTSARKVVKKPAAKKTAASKSSALNQKTGRLKKGYRYGKGGRIVKAKTAK